MGLEFITRLIKTTAVIALIVALYLTVYVGGRTALGFLIGVVWSLVNLYFLRGLVKEVITPSDTRKDIAIILGLIKFPVLYVIGYFVIASDYFSLYALLAGFSLIFPIALLKVLGRLYLKMDTLGFSSKHREQQS